MTKSPGERWTKILKNHKILEDDFLTGEWIFCEWPVWAEQREARGFSSIDKIKAWLEKAKYFYK